MRLGKTNRGHAAGLIVSVVAAMGLATAPASAAALLGIAQDTAVTSINPFVNASWLGLGQAKARFRLIADYNIQGSASGCSTAPDPAAPAGSATELSRVTGLIDNAYAAGAEIVVTLRITDSGAPPTVAQYGCAVRKMIQQYGTKVSYWGTLNEPNVYWPNPVRLTSPYTPYAALVASYYNRLVTETGSASKVLGPDLVDTWDNQTDHISVNDNYLDHDPQTGVQEGGSLEKWLDAYIAAGGGFGAAASFHPYGAISRRTTLPITNYASHLPGSTPIWLTEAGARKKKSTDGTFKDLYVDNNKVDDSLQATQISYLLNTIGAVGGSHPVNRTYYYSLNSDPFETGLIAQNGVVRPGYSVFCAAAGGSCTTTPGSITPHGLGEFQRASTGSWQPWDITNLAGAPTITQKPSAINDPGNNQLLVLARSTSNHLVQFQRQFSGSWNYYDITVAAGGPDITGPPYAMQDSNGELIAFAQSGSHLVQFRRTTAGAWYSYDITNLSGGSIGSAPTGIFDPGNGRLLAVARNASNHVIQFERTPAGGWNAWDVTNFTGGTTVGEDPVPLKDPISNDLLIVATTSNGHLMQFDRSSGGAWSAWDLTNITGGTVGVAGIVRPFIDGNHILIFARGAGNHLVQFDRNGGGSWSTYDVTNGSGGWAIAGNASPIPFRDTNGDVVVFAIGASNHLIQLDRSSVGAWTGFDLTSIAGPTIDSDPTPWLDPASSSLLAYAAAT